MIEGASVEHTKMLHSRKIIEQMAPYYKALNIVQDTGWHINAHVLDTVKELRARKLNIWGIPSLADVSDYPEFNPNQDKLKVRAHEDGTSEVVRPGDHDYGDKGLKFLMEEDRNEFKLWKRDKSAFFKERAIAASQLMARACAITTAESYAAYPSLYFVYHADSRGRIYPYARVLSPQGSDLEKALLEFDTEFPLNPQFLGLQITGVYGYDKHTYKDRLKWVEDNHDNLMLVGESPLARDAREFITQADDPWQLIACCRDYWLHHAHGKTTSRLWWAQDGACNGLQHFSMMLADEKGGALVNLTNNSTPSDIYQHVADLTQDKLDADLADGEIPAIQEYCTFAAEVGVNRKLTKRPTMIKPYAGTRMGATAYIKEFYDEWITKHPNEVAGFLSASVKDSEGKLQGGYRGFINYMGGRVWHSVEESVEKATEAMSWLKHVGTQVGASGKQLYWTVPSTGFFGGQAKWDVTRQLIRSHMFGMLYSHNWRATANLSKSSMGTALAPNFVHSLDSAHMLTTVLAAAEQGITHFALIHDSYGAPLHQSNELAYHIRDAFYHLYTDRDVLLEFAEDQQRQHPEVEYKDLPMLGNLNRTEVYNARYMFS